MKQCLTYALQLSFENNSLLCSSFHIKGGLLARSTGVIYAFPAHSNEVLCVDTNVKQSVKGQNVGENDGKESWRVSTIPIKRHENDTDPHDLQYKWLGGSYGADGW